MIANRTQEQTDLENRETCKRIATELDKIAAGTIYRCPECGDLIDADEAETDVNDRTLCPCCHKWIDADEMEPYTIYDYFEDALDVEYIVGSDRTYRGVRVMVACGGPNIFVDTMEKAVTLFWWTDRARYYLSSDAVDAVDECFEELWNM